MLRTFREPHLQDVQAVLETDMTTSPGPAELGQAGGGGARIHSRSARFSVTAGDLPD